jgi:hypothetical protein
MGLAIFKVLDPAKPDAPPQERVINERYVVDVEPVYRDSGSEQSSYLPVGSNIILSDKRKLRVPQRPRDVLLAFKRGGVE